MATRIAYAVHISAPVQALQGTAADAVEYVRGAFTAVLALAERSASPVAVAAENLAWRAAPVGVLHDAVKAGRVALLATHAHNAHAAYLTPGEAGDEVRENALAVSEIFGEPPPDIVLPPGLAYRRIFGEAYRVAGARAVVLPTPSPVDPGAGLHAVSAPPAWLEAWELSLAARDYGLWESAVQTGSGVQAVFLRGSDGAAAWLEGAPALGPAHALPVEEGAGEGPSDFAPRPVAQAYVRWDGVYPPPGAPVAAGPSDEPARLYARYPFILFEAGRPLYRLLAGLAAAFPSLDLLGYVRMAAHADLWGPVWTPEGQHAAGRLCSTFAHRVREGLNEGVPPGSDEGLDPLLAVALRASLAFFVDNPLNAAERAVREQGGEPGAPVAAVREHRLRAAEGLMRLEQALGALRRTPGAWYRVADMLDLFGREWSTAAALFGEWRSLRGGLPEPRASAMAAVYPPQLAVLLDRFFAPGPVRARALPEEFRAGERP